GGLPRPLVPGPRRHAHPGLRGHRGEPGELVLVRGQLRVLPGPQGPAPGRGGRSPAPRDLPSPDPRLTALAAAAGRGDDGPPLTPVRGGPSPSVPGLRTPPRRSPRGRGRRRP